LPLVPGIAAVSTSSIFSCPRWSSSMIAAAVNVFVVLAPRKWVASVVPGTVLAKDSPAGVITTAVRPPMSTPA
jgi:hypothetical protein